MAKQPDRVERRGDLEAENGVFRSAVSTETPVPGRRHPREVLSHDPGAVDLKRARKKGLPLRAEHGGLPVGRAFEFSIVNRTLRADRIELAPSHKHLAEDIDGGFIDEVSVSAEVMPDAWEEVGEDLVARRWRPVEISLVAVGGDEGASIGRSGTGATEMSGESGKDTGSDAVQRSRDIEAVFAGLEGEQWVKMERDALRGTESADVVRGKVTEELKRIAAQAPRQSSGHVSVGADHLDKWLDGVERTLDYRTGQLDKAERTKYERQAHADEFAGLTLREMAREYLRVRQLPVTGTMEQVVDRALFTPAVSRAIFSHTTSDFANLLGSSADKALGSGYVENSETYQQWTRSKTVSNFRDHEFYNLSTFGDLEEIPQSGTYTQAPMADKSESARAREYGRNFAISRQMVINDDLNAFTGIPGAMGRAAARKVGDLVYAVLTDNATMNETSRALFNTTDGNLAASGAAISTTTLGAARLAMRTRTALAPGEGEAGATLNTRAQYMLVPAALETAAETLLASQRDPAEGSTTSFAAANIFASAYDLIVEPRLDADSTTAWYMLAATTAPVETVAVLWLNGVQRPMLSQVSGFDENGGIRFKVRIDAGALAVDWRGMFKNPGA